MSLILTAGLALFAMFFGSGNLIFPLEVGIKAQGFSQGAFLGLLATAIFVPLIGLLSVIGRSQDGSTKEFFQQS